MMDPVPFTFKVEPVYGREQQGDQDRPQQQQESFDYPQQYGYLGFGFGDQQEVPERSPRIGIQGMRGKRAIRGKRFARGKRDMRGKRSVLDSKRAAFLQRMKEWNEVNQESFAEKLD